MVYSFGDFVFIFFSNHRGWQNHFRGLRGRVEAFVVVSSSASAFYSCAKMMMIVQTENLEWGNPFPSHIHRHFPRAKGGEIETEKMYPHNTIQRGEGAETENWLDEKNPLIWKSLLHECGKNWIKLRISGRKSGSLDLKHSLLICGKDESLDARRKKRRKKIPTLDFPSNGLPQSANRACVHYTCTPVNKIHSPPSALSVSRKGEETFEMPGRT